MFVSQEERERETPAQRDLRRSVTGVDRRGLKQVAIAMVIIFGGMASVIASDVVGVDRRRTTATVVGFVDRTSQRTRHCITQLTTGYGDAEIFTRDTCRNARWHIGDQAEVIARQLRFSRVVVVSTRGTIFDGAHTFLPES